jgi:hypothetical protein
MFEPSIKTLICLWIQYVNPTAVKVFGGRRISLDAENDFSYSYICTPSKDNLYQQQAVLISIYVYNGFLLLITGLISASMLEVNSIFSESRFIFATIIDTLFAAVLRITVRNSEWLTPNNDFTWVISVWWACMFHMILLFAPKFWTIYSNASKNKLKKAQKNLLSTSGTANSPSNKSGKESAISEKKLIATAVTNEVILIDILKKRKTNVFKDFGRFCPV